MKNIFFLILYLSMFSFSHSAKEGDLDGAWRTIEAFINGERQEVVDGLMVATEGYMSVIGQQLMAINTLTIPLMNLMEV